MREVTHEKENTEEKKLKWIRLIKGGKKGIRAWRGMRARGVD